MGEGCLSAGGQHAGALLFEGGVVNRRNGAAIYAEHVAHPIKVVQRRQIRTGEPAFGLPTAAAHVPAEGTDGHAVSVELCRYPVTEAGGGAEALEFIIAFEFKIGEFGGDAERGRAVAIGACLFKGQDTLGECLMSLLIEFMHLVVRFDVIASAATQDKIP